ncbi:hypothetical protein WJX84_003818, partial [Apatococcus fuscideae]
MGCACFRSQPPPPERVQVIRQSVSPTLPEPVEPRPPSPTTALEPITLTEEPAAGKEDRKPYVLVKLPNRAAVEITRSFFQRPDNELLDSCMSSKILNDKAEFQPGTDVLWFDVYKKTHQHALIRYIDQLPEGWTPETVHRLGLADFSIDVWPIRVQHEIRALRLTVDEHRMVAKIEGGIRTVIQEEASKGSTRHHQESPELRQAGLMLWQLLYPPGGARTERQLDAVKLNAIEAAMKALGSGTPMEMGAAAGVTSTLLPAEGAADQLLKQAATSVPTLLRAISKGTPGAAAPALGVLRMLAEGTSTRLRLMRALEPLDWTPIIQALSFPPDALAAGGRMACVDAALLLKALVLPAEPKAEEPEAATAAVDPKTGKAAAPARPTTSGKGAKAPKADPKAKPVLPVPQALKDAMLAQMRAANGLKALLEMVGRAHASPIAKHASIEVITAALRLQPAEAADLISSGSNLAGICVVLGDSQAALPLRASAAGLLKSFLALEGGTAPATAASALPDGLLSRPGPGLAAPALPAAYPISGFTDYPPGRRPASRQMITITVPDHSAASRRSSGFEIPAEGATTQDTKPRTTFELSQNGAMSPGMEGAASRRTTLREQLQAPQATSMKHRLASVSWRTKSMGPGEVVDLKAAAAAALQGSSQFSPAMQSLVVGEDPWSDAALSRTAAMGSARGSTSGDIATVWLNIQRQSQQAAAKSSLTSSPRQDWSNEVAAASPRTGFHGAQQVLFEDVFLDMDKRNEALVRVQLVARAGGLGPLIQLCGAAPAAVAKAPQAGKPGSKKKPPKKGKAQAPPGLAEAHANAAACL